MKEKCATRSNVVAQVQKTEYVAGMKHCLRLICCAVVAAAFIQCAPPVAQPSTTPAPTKGDQMHDPRVPNQHSTAIRQPVVGGPQTVAECPIPEGVSCKHVAIRLEHICYGRDPGPGAEKSRRECVCDECLQDNECGSGKRCYQVSPTCGAPRNTCIPSCDKGQCSAGAVCSEGYCVPLPRPGPP